MHQKCMHKSSVFPHRIVVLALLSSLLLTSIRVNYNIVDGFCILPTRRLHYQSSQLYGVHEWREKFSSKNSTQQQQLPLLLLPFNPSQILLPGQSTKYTFRHGKYLDLIDECISTYGCTIGMSILSDDGLLPITVLCEVMEETLDIHMGYRGFSYMEVGIRAVGRVRRCDIVEGKSDAVDNSDNSYKDEKDDSELIRTTALDDIHHGMFVDWFDDPLDEEEKITANEYRENILSILRLWKEEEKEEEQAERLRCQQRRYESACEIVALNNKSSKEDDEEEFVAASWGALAAAGTADDNGSINIDALTTTNTVERLRLGLAMLLENQMPLGRSSTVGGEIRRSDGVDEDKNPSAIEPDETDAFQ